MKKLILPIFLIACGHGNQSEEYTNDNQFVVAAAEEECKKDNTGCIEEDVAEADMIVTSSATFVDDMVTMADLIELTTGELSTNPIYRNEKLVGYIQYLSNNFGIKTRCSEEIDEKSCFDSVKTLVEATTLRQFPRNPEFIPVAEIDILDLGESDSDYYIGLDDRVYIRANINASSQKWARIISEALSDDERMELIRGKENNLKNLSDMEHFFGRSISKHHNLDDEEFHQGLRLLRLVSNLDVDARRPGIVLNNETDRKDSLGNKAYQNIVIGSENRYIYENNAKANVMIDLSDTPKNIYSHLISQPNSPILDLNGFQLAYLSGTKRHKKDQDLFLESKQKVVEIVALQKEVDALSRELSALIDVDVECSFDMDEKRLLFVSVGISLGTCHESLLRLKNRITNLGEIDGVQIADSYCRDHSIPIQCSVIEALIQNPEAHVKIVIRNDRVDIQDKVLFLNKRIHNHDAILVKILMNGRSSAQKT